MSSGSGSTTFFLKTTGSQSLTAQSGSLSASSTSIYVNPAAASTLFTTLSATPSSGILADNLSQSSISIALKDLYNNQLTGITPSLTSSAGAYASITQPSATDSSGTTSALLSSSVGGTQTLGFSSPSSLAGPSGENTSISFIPYIVASANSSISVSPAALNADGVSQSTITLSLSDVGSNLITSGISVTLSSSRGSLDNLSSTTSTSDSSGKATFTLSSTSIGITKITASTTNAILSTYVEFFSDTSSLIGNYSARLFDGYQPGNNSASTKSNWYNLASTTRASLLGGFTYTSTNGWSGDGSSTSPYNLTFVSSTSDYVSLGRGYNTFTNFSFELSVAPTSATTRGSVLLSNADSWGGGFTLRQSKDGQGRVELVLGSTLSSYTDEILSDSPKAYYRLGDSTTSKAYDSSGNSYHATYSSSGVTVGGPGALTFDSDTAVQLNGTAGYVSLPTNVFTQVTNSTVEAWFKINTGNYGGIVLLSNTLYPTASSGYRDILYVDTSGYLRGSYYTTSGAALSSSSTVRDGKWHYSAFTKAGNTQILYLDGVSQATSTTTLASPLSTANQYVYLGLSYNDSATDYPSLPASSYAAFPGQLDEVAFYYSTLTSTQIANHYAARMNASCLSDSILKNNRYYLISGVYNGLSSVLSLAINGNLECSVTSNQLFIASSLPMIAGAAFDGSSASNFFSGSISDIRFYSSALSTTTQASDYNAVSGTNGSSTPGASNYNPTVSISSPTNGSVINSSNDSTSFQVTGSCDSQSTASIDIYVDGSDATPTSALCMGSLFSNSINTTALATGSHSLTAILTNGSNTITSSPVLVSRNLSDTTVARLSVSGFPSPQTAGTPGTFFVSALDSFGYIIPTYTGTLTFSSSDTLANLPAQYTFTSSDNGVHTFSATLNSSGIQSITATDNAKALIGTQSGINVYSSLVADWPFSYGTDSAYTFDSTLIRLNSSGVAQLIYSQTDSGSTFSTGTLNGVTYDSSNQLLTLNVSTNITELDSTWTPAYSNLVGYWKFNGSNSIANGTSISSTVGPSLTASNASGTGLTYSSGQLNQAISFDGVDDYLYSNATTMSVSGNFTVAAWAMATSTTGTRSIVGTQNGTANAVDLGFLGNYGLYVNVGNGTANVMSLNTNTTWALSTSTFHHVVLSMKSTGGALYLDGNTVASGTVSSGTPLLTDSTRTLTIGNLKNAGTSPFIGAIDEVALWNTALSTAQIQALYQRQSATYSGLFSSRVFTSSSLTSVSASSQLPYYKNLPPNASSESTTSYPALTTTNLMSGNVGLWHFDENAGSTTFADSSGNGNNGTAVGALYTGVTGKLGNLETPLGQMAVQAFM